MPQTVNTILIKVNDTQAILFDGYQNNGVTAVAVSDNGEFNIANLGGAPVTNESYRIVNPSTFNADTYGGSENVLQLDARDYVSIQISHHPQEQKRDRLGLEYIDPDKRENRLTSIPLFHALSQSNNGTPLMEANRLREHPLKTKSSFTKPPPNTPNSENTTKKISDIKHIALSVQGDEDKIYVVPLSQEAKENIQINTLKGDAENLSISTIANYTSYTPEEFKAFYTDNFMSVIFHEGIEPERRIQIHNDPSKGILDMKVLSPEDLEAQAKTPNPAFELNRAL